MKAPSARLIYPALAVQLGSLPVSAPLAAEDRSQQTDPTESSRVVTSTAVYVDHVIDPGSLTAFATDPADTYDDRGLPRSYSLESSWASTTVDANRSKEYGLAGSAFWETVLWGSYSVNGGLYKTSLAESYAPSGTLWQRGLNLDDAWQLNNGLGVVNAPLTALQRNQTRFFLPSTALLGLVSEWNHPAGIQLVAGAGTPGRFESGRLSGFETDTGRTGAVGADWALADNAQIGLSWLRTQDRITQDAFTTSPPNAESLFATGAWQAAHSRLQLNLLSTDYGLDQTAALDTGKLDTSPVGSWLDVNTQIGRFQHDYGLFHFDPGLNWGGELMNSDAQGGYYRVNHQKMRWSWGSSLDYLQPITDPDADSVYSSGNLRYQASSRTGIGGTGTVRSGDTRAYRANLFGDQRTVYGISRLQIDQAKDGDDRTSWQIGLDQSLPETGWGRISTTLNFREIDGMAVENKGSETSRITELVIYGSHDLFGRVSLDGSIRGTAGSGPEAETGFFANLGVNWEINAHWQLLATYDRSTAARQNPFVLQPFPERSRLDSSTESEFLFLTLRYTHQAGRRTGILGGAPGSPAGLIKGSVFLDENGDGRRNAGEQVAANIAVTLDDRFTTQTDAQGKFVFPLVAVGNHVIEASPDNLPLPWQFAPDDAVKTIELGVRDRINIDLAAQRM